MHFTKTLSTMITALLFTGAFFGKAQSQTTQNSSDKDEYRIVAVKKGEMETQSTSNQLALEKNFSVYIPNAFTPNGDGLNDTFEPVARGIQSLEMEVFNRWGEKIFEADSEEARWDGTHGGKEAQSGVYVYKIRAQTLSGEYITKKGHVTLVD